MLLFKKLLAKNDEFRSPVTTPTEHLAIMKWRDVKRTRKTSVQSNRSIKYIDTIPIVTSNGNILEVTYRLGTCFVYIRYMWSNRVLAIKPIGRFNFVAQNNKLTVHGAIICFKKRWSSNVFFHVYKALKSLPMKSRYWMFWIKTSEKMGF